uniref:Uncharacterized protein n=1 Tax=Sinocyclocheilus grahami TaxID=75366 RepID=A0A672R3N3_SINGR
MKHFLEGRILPRLNEEHRKVLSSSISKDEILEAIGLLKNGPRPDGFGSGFYKKCGHIITDQLLKVYSTSFEKGTLPQTFYQANIHLILKRK